MSPETPRPDVETLAAGPIDETDIRVLRRMAGVYSIVDPVPPALVDRIQFGITLDALHAEIAELQRSGDLVGVRSQEATEAQTVTFTSESTTTMVTITPVSADRVRIDGWVAPGRRRGGRAADRRREPDHDGRRARPVRLRRGATRPGPVRPSSAARLGGRTGVHAVDRDLALVDVGATRLRVDAVRLHALAVEQYNVGMPARALRTLDRALSVLDLGPVTSTNVSGTPCQRPDLDEYRAQRVRGAICRARHRGPREGGGVRRTRRGPGGGRPGAVPTWADRTAWRSPRALARRPRRRGQADPACRAASAVQHSAQPRNGVPCPGRTRARALGPPTRSGDRPGQRQRGRRVQGPAQPWLSGVPSRRPAAGAAFDRPGEPTARRRLAWRARSSTGRAS